MHRVQDVHDGVSFWRHDTCRGRSALLHVIALSMDLGSMARFMIEMGSTQAMKLDGGGSTGLMENGKLTLGYAWRPIPSALVLRGLTDQEPPQEPVVMLDPGHGLPDSGAVGEGGLPEADVVLDICLAARTFLAHAGVRALTTRETQAGLALV